MKNKHHITSNDVVDNRMEMSHHQGKVPISKLLSGSVADKYAVTLDDGRTVVYISDKTRESEIRLRYALLRR